MPASFRCCPNREINRLPIDVQHPRSPSLDLPSLRGFLRRAQTAVGLPGVVGVSLMDDLTIRRLNRQFRHKNKATDVLSFPADPRPLAPDPYARAHAGDLAISLDTAARQARQHHHALGIEVRILVLHGLLHLAGMDHEADQGEMRARERALRRRFHLPEGLIERSQ